jgi:hypothetical protein
MRVSTGVVLSMLLMSVVATDGAAQPASAKAPTDFSGTWTFDQIKSAQPGPDGKVVLAAMLGDEFTATQDGGALVLAIKAGGVRLTATYKLDGTESRNMSPGAFGQPAVEVISRASWEGDRLVIKSSSVSVLSGRNVPIETRRVLRIDADGSLVVERTGTPVTEVTPSRSIYRKVK